VIPNSALRGNWAAGAPNYIDGYYADPDPKKKASDVLKPTNWVRA
jgi:hypothetical protein